MNHYSDGELLQRWAEARDEAAFRALIERHGALLTGIARRRLSEPDLAPDIAGRAFALLAQGSTRVPKGEVAGWLVRATVHLSNTENRTCRRRLAREAKANQEFARSQSTMPPRTDDLSLRIDELLLTLNPTDRECLLLHSGEGLTNREVGERLGVSEDAVRMRVQRALERIRRRLGLSATAFLPVFEQWKVISFSSSDHSRLVQAALHAPALPGGLVSIGWLLMTTTQRNAIVIAFALLLLGGTGAAFTVQGQTKSPVTLAKPDLTVFQGKWKGTLTYVVRRTGRRVTMDAKSEISGSGEALRFKVNYGDPNWAVDAKVQVLTGKRELIYEDKGVRQTYRLTSTKKEGFTGERFVDEPGRPRDERITFLHEPNRVSVVIEEKLQNAGWIFANSHVMEAVR